MLQAGHVNTQHATVAVKAKYDVMAAHNWQHVSSRQGSMTRAHLLLLGLPNSNPWL